MREGEVEVYKHLLQLVSLHTHLLIAGDYHCC